jgi:hypothetical protein
MFTMDIPSFSRSPLGVGLQYVKPPKRKVFISYHHKNDQGWSDNFSNYFSDTLDLFYDNSLERKIDSADSKYLNQKIREDCIFGTSLTIVLCGLETWKRRWVDWEIHATLYYEHGLLGIGLPTCVRTNDLKYIVPDRLYKNFESGYAQWMIWTPDAKVLSQNIEQAVRKSSQKKLIMNTDPKIQRSYS